MGQGKMRNMTADSLKVEYSETETSEDSSSPSPSDGVCRGSVADVLDSNVSEQTGWSFLLSLSTLLFLTLWFLRGSLEDTKDKTSWYRRQAFAWQN